MTQYSVQPRDRIFVEDFGFLSFPRNMGQNIGKNISKNLSCKNSQKLLDHAKQSLQMHLKLLQKEQFKKTTESTGDLKIAEKITRVSKTSLQNKSVTHEEEILRARYLSPEERQKVIDDLRLI